jgi:hypothetical protein
MNIKQSKKIIISLSKPDKMPGYAYGLPAWECKTGAKLVKVPGSVCAGCYALKGNYARYPEIKKSQYKRLASISRPEWVEAMAVVINSKAVAQHGYFRWHDAGDIQSPEHLQKIFQVCKLTPSVKHWMPTREAQFLKDIDPAQVPDNLIIRMSSHMIDQGPVTFWPHTSTVGSSTRTCPAPDQGGKCGSCRTCWNKEIPNIEYGKH